MRTDPLLTDERSAGRSAGAGRATAPPYGRRRIVAALGLVCRGRAGRRSAVVNVLDGDDPATDGAAAATGDRTGRPPTPATTTPPTVPSIDGVGSLWWLVNRDRPLPDGYVPADLVVPNVPFDPDAGGDPADGGHGGGVRGHGRPTPPPPGTQLQLNSGYRSADDQQRLYDAFVDDYGQEDADQLVARAGHERAPDRHGRRRRARRPPRRPGLRIDAGERLGRRQRPAVRLHPPLPAGQGRHHRLRQRAVAPALRRHRARPTSCSPAARRWRSASGSCPAPPRAEPGDGEAPPADAGRRCEHFANRSAWDGGRAPRGGGIGA